MEVDERHAVLVVLERGCKDVGALGADGWEREEDRQLLEGREVLRDSVAAARCM